MSLHTELSFDCVLPSALLFNENVEPACVKAYAVIRNLSKQSGYCYATNEYLSNILKCDVSTIKRWISSLEKEGYLDLETDKKGINWQRKIFISNRFTAKFTKAQNCAPPSSKMSHTIEENTNKEELSVCPPEVGLDPPKKVEKTKTNGEKISIEKDDIIRKAIQTNTGWTPQEIEDVWNILVKYPGGVNDIWRFIEGTIENIRKKKRFKELKCQEKNLKKARPSGIAPLPITQEELDMRKRLSQTLFCP